MILQLLIFLNFCIIEKNILNIFSNLKITINSISQGDLID